MEPEQNTGSEEQGSVEQIDPRGDMLNLRGDGDVEPGGLVPPYEGRTTSSEDHEQGEDAGSESD